MKRELVRIRRHVARLWIRSTKSIAAREQLRTADMIDAINTIRTILGIVFDIADHFGVQHDVLSGLLSDEAVKRANAKADLAEQAKFGA